MPGRSSGAKSPNPYELSSVVGSTADGSQSHSQSHSQTRGRAISLSAILEAHHTADESQKFEFLRELEEQCREMGSDAPPAVDSASGTCL